jgi:hypothetical protein
MIIFKMANNMPTYTCMCACVCALCAQFRDVRSERVESTPDRGVWQREKEGEKGLLYTSNTFVF